MLHQLTGHNAAVNAVTFNPAGSILITGSDDARILSWDVQGGSQIMHFEATWPVVRLRYAEGGRDFFSWANAGATQIFSLWNGATGARLFSNDQIVPDTFSANMRYALTGGNKTALQVLNAGRLSVEREFTRGFNWGSDSVTAAAFRGETGSQLLIGLQNSGNENRLVLADLGSGEITTTFQGEAARRVNAAAVNPNGTLGLTGFGNQLVLWDLQRGIELRRLSAHNDLVDHIEFSPDGRYALSTSRDGNSRVWDITGGDSAEQLRVKAETQIATANFPGFNPQRNSVYAGVWIDLFEWSGQTGQQTNRVTVGAEIKNVLYNPVKPQAVTILDNVAILWNLDAGVNGLVNRFANSDDHMNGAGAFSPNGDWLVLDGRSQIYVYDMTTQRRTVNINKPQMPQNYIVTDLAISSDGHYVVGSTGDPSVEENAPGEIYVWDSTTGDLLMTLSHEHTRTVNSVEISPDGRSLLTASDDNTLILWDLASGQVLKRFAGHTGDVNVALFSPDPNNPFIISASDDAAIILWDLASALPLRRFQGHTDPIVGLNISPDGQRMISSTGGDTMIIWHIETPQEVIQWTLANRYVKAFTPDECAQYNVPDCNAGVVPQNSAPQPTLALVPTQAAPALEPTSAPSPVPVAQQVFATNSGSQNVNVRSSDSTQASVVGMLRVNERVQVLGVSSRGDNWYQIMLADGRLAWVSGSVVSLEGDLAALPQIDSPSVAAPPTQALSSPGSSTGTGEGETEPTENASAYDCSAFRLTSPIGYINAGPTTFYWDPLPGVTGDYWLSIFNEGGQQVSLSDVGNATSVTIDTSAAAIGPGFTFSYEVNVFVNGVNACPASGSVGQRPS